VDLNRGNKLEEDGWKLEEGRAVCLAEFSCLRFAMVVL